MLAADLFQQGAIEREQIALTNGEAHVCRDPTEAQSVGESTKIEGVQGLSPPWEGQSPAKVRAFDDRSAFADPPFVLSPTIRGAVVQHRLGLLTNDRI